MANVDNLNPKPSDILHKIKHFVRSLVVGLANNRPLTIVLPRYRNYCSDPSGNCTCSSDLPCGKEFILLEKESHANRLDIILRLLLIVQHLLQENKHGSKRDIYYMKPSVFKRQDVVDQALNDICILLKCSRHNLNVVPVGKGLLMGWLKFTESGRDVYCIRNLNNAYPVPVCLENVECIVSVAKYILVVEKETGYVPMLIYISLVKRQFFIYDYRCSSVFQRLANDNFCDKNQCIVITGKGYPDVPTRRFLRHLVEQLQLPVYCLVDSDPYGFDILATYRFGSMTMAYDAKYLRVPEIRWLGVFPSEYEKYHLPDRCLLPMTTDDKNKARAMMSRCYLQREAPRWRFELETMLQRGVKFEIEALSVSSLSFLSEEYLPTKIKDGAHI